MPVKLSRVLHWSQVTAAHRTALGEKCYNLVRFKKAGYPVPPLVAIPNTEVARILREGEISSELEKGVRENVALLEKETGLKLGDPKSPLILVVRSGDPRHLYGALLTIPSVGLNDLTLEGLVRRYGPGAENGVLWLYLDLIVDFARHVGGISKEQIAPILERMRDKDKSASDLKTLIQDAQSVYYDYSKSQFPTNVYDQLLAAIRAVAFSWNSTMAKCAAMCAGLDPENPAHFPSVFIQQMKFTSLTTDSAFVSLLTHPELSGTFAPATVGRRVMFGATRSAMGLDSLMIRNPELYKLIIVGIVRPLVESEKDALNLELAIESSLPYLLQVSKAVLSPAKQIEAINRLVLEKVITEEEAIRKRSKVQTERKIKMYRIKPSAALEILAEGKPVSPGAMHGRVAVSIEDALRIKKNKQRVIMFCGEPRDEGVYWLTMGGNLDGLVVTFGAGRSSHITDFANANGIPMVASIRNMEIFEGGVKIGERALRVGDWVVIEGSEGKIYTSNDPEPIVEDVTVINLSYGIDHVSLLRSVRNRYYNYSYEEILKLHSEDFKGLERNRSFLSKEERAGLQARIHCLHLLAYEKGEALGKSRMAVDLDVAVADGNLSRIPGLEDRDFAIEEEKDGRYLLITGGEVSYGNFDYVIEGFTDVDELVKIGRKQGLKIERFCDRRKLSMHTQELICYGITFPREQLTMVVEFLRNFFEKSKFSP